MELEILDRLEDKVDVCVSAMRDLRAENEALRAENRALEQKVAALGREAEAGSTQRADAEHWRERCTELEKKMERVRGRIESMVEKIKTLEG